MTLQASGTIKLSEIAAEFGKSAPYSLSDFYRGGTYVPDIAANSNVPTSGNIQLTDFYSAETATVVSSVAGGADIDQTIADNTANWPQTVQSSLRTAVPSPADDGNYSYSWTRVSTTINNGRQISVTNGNAAATRFQAFLDIPAESSNTEVWRITVTDGFGNSVSDDITVKLTSQDAGS